MSTELVKRIAAYLRATSERDITLYEGHPSVLLHEAADELTALTAKVALLTEALRQHEKLLCLNAVRDAARQTAPLWLEAADAAASRARSEPDKEGML